MNKYALQIITLIFLAIAVFFDSDDLPYGFFTILHFVVCSYFGYKAYLYYIKEKNISFMFCFLALFAITYNPFVKVRLYDKWLLINILTIIFIVCIEFLTLQIIKKCGNFLLNAVKILILPTIIIWIAYDSYNSRIEKIENAERARIIKEKKEQLFADLGFYTAIFEYIPDRCKKAGYEQEIVNNVKKDYQSEINILLRRAKSTYTSGGKNFIEIYHSFPPERMNTLAEKGWGYARTAAVIKKILEKHKDNPKEFENIMTDILMTGNIEEFAAKYQANPEDENILTDLLKTIDISKYNYLVTEKDICIALEETFKNDYKIFAGFLEKYNIDHKKHNPLLLRSGARWVIEQPTPAPKPQKKTVKQPAKKYIQTPEPQPIQKEDEVNKPILSIGNYVLWGN